MTAKFGSPSSIRSLSRVGAQLGERTSTEALPVPARMGRIIGYVIYWPGRGWILIFLAAAESGQLAALEALVQRAVHDGQVQDRYWYKAAVAAVRNVHVDVVDFLLVNAKTLEDRDAAAWK
jgi:hypothetical protein